MTPEVFIDELEQIFDKHLKPQQAPLYLDKLRRFSDTQLLELLNKVLEEAKYFPKVSEIFKAAESLGFLSVDTNSFKPHAWNKTDCRLCQGEGRLCVTWLVQFDNGQEMQALSQIMPYATSLQAEVLKLKSNEFTSIFRCSCLAGEASTLPKAWPRWNRSIQPVRYV